MKSQHQSQDSDKLHTIWYVIPALWVAAAAAFIVLSQTSLPDAETGQADRPDGTTASAPYVSSDPSVPSADGVFKDRSYQEVQHVDTF